MRLPDGWIMLTAPGGGPVYVRASAIDHIVPDGSNGSRITGAGFQWSVRQTPEQIFGAMEGAAQYAAAFRAGAEAMRERAAELAAETDTGWFDARTFTAQKIAAAIRAADLPEPPR
jgi:hypothetical protein